MNEGCFEEMAIGWFNAKANAQTSMFSAIDTEILQNKSLYETSEFMVNRSFCRCIIPEEKRKSDEECYLYFSSIDVARLDPDGEICDVISIDYELVEV